MDHVHTIRTCTTHVKDYLTDLAPLAKEAISVTLQAVYLHIRLVAKTLHPFLTLLVYLYYALTPLLTHVVHTCLIAFTQQPRHVVMAELTATTTLLTLIALERRFAFLRRTHALYVRTHAHLKRRGRRLLAHVRAKSRLAASLLPHVVFVAGASVFHYTVGQSFLPHTRGGGLIAIACVRPAIRTLLLLYSVDVDATCYEDVTPTSVRSSDDDASSSDSVSVISASAVRQAGELGTHTPSSDSMRRRHTGGQLSLDSPSSMRKRAATVAKEIEQEADDPPSVTATPNTANRAKLVPAKRRVRIDETPQTSFFLRVAQSARASLPLSASGRSMTGRVSSSTTPLSSTTSTCLVTPSPMRHRDGVEDVCRARSESTVLRFWVLFGFAWGVRTLTWYFSPLFLGSVVAQLDVCMFYLFVWAQFSLTMGADLLYPPFAAFLAKRGFLRRTAKRVVDSVHEVGGDETAQQLGLIMRLLSSLRLFESLKAGRIWRLASDSGVFVVLGCLSIIVPRLLMFVATLLGGLLLPCVWSTHALESGETYEIGLQRHNWLAYWGVFSLVDAVYAISSESFEWLPLWYHIKMAIILWLQVPDSRGAVKVLDRFMRHVGIALSSVKKQTVTPRKRKRG